MSPLESGLHLYQPPFYRSADGQWHPTFAQALAASPERLTWDPAAILSILSFSYICGDRTLLKEIKRQTWISEISPEGQLRLADIPPHATFRASPSEIAQGLRHRLIEEAATVCQGRSTIYVLLSGGLDSRVVAGVVAQLWQSGQLENQPIAMTWGLADSRDVVYGRQVAEALGFDWLHIGIGPEDLRRNIEEVAYTLDGSVSPVDLHAMAHLHTLPKEALVLAGSYGDSVGRAEYNRRHILEIRPLSPANTFGLLHADMLNEAYQGLRDELKGLHDRTPGQPRYVLCEHEMQGHYMRSLIAHAMSIINNYCTVYQMFTHPRVYSYIWSIHPAFRTDQVYMELFKQLDPKLAQVPWARTNRTLEGRSIEGNADLRPRFHAAPDWITGPLYDELCRMVDPDWFAATGLFDQARIVNLREVVQQPFLDSRHYYTFLWLAAFRRFAERLDTLGKTVGAPSTKPTTASTGVERVMQNTRSKYWKNLLYPRVKPFRLQLLRYKALRDYPPRSGKPEDVPPVY